MYVAVRLYSQSPSSDLLPAQESRVFARDVTISDHAIAVAPSPKASAYERRFAHKLLYLLVCSLVPRRFTA